MSIHRRATLLGFTLLAAAFPHALGAQAQSLAGTWTLNAAKSTYDPPDLGNKSGTVTYTFSGNSVTARVNQLNAKGQLVKFEYTATLDGADAPWKGTIDGKPIAGQDAVTFKKLDANTYHVENKLKGKVTTINHIVISADGRTRTVTTTGTSADGKKIHNVAVFDKR